MNRVTAASAAFLVFAIGVSAWLLTRPRESVDAAASAGGAAGGAGSPVGLTFAEWSVRNDGVLLADIDPGKGAGAASTAPKRFLYLPVVREPGGTITVSPGRGFSWAPADRKESAEALFALGFRVNPDDRAFAPPGDPLWSDAVAGSSDGGADQVVKLRAKSGAGADGVTAHFDRKRSDPRAVPFLGRRAIGFPSSDGHMVYVTPDAIVVPADPH